MVCVSFSGRQQGARLERPMKIIQISHGAIFVLLLLLL